MSQIAHFLVLITAIGISWILGSCGCSATWMVATATFMFSVLRQVIVAEDAQSKKKSKTLDSSSFTTTVESSQSAHWVNSALQKWWCFSSPSMSSVLVDRLNTAVGCVLPELFTELKISSLQLGDTAPIFQNIKILNVKDDNSGLDQIPHYKLAVTADVEFTPGTFEMALSCRMNSDWVAMPLLLSVDNITVSGPVQAVLDMDTDIPFPHISAVSFFFTQRPQVWFSLKLLNVLPLTEIPLIKSHIHTMVTEALTQQIVDPYAVTIPIGGFGPRSLVSPVENFVPANGVLTVCVQGSVYNYSHEDECDSSVIQIGQQQQSLPFCTSSKRWETSRSFLVHDPALQTLVLQMKGRKFLSQYTMATFQVKLSDFPWERQKIVKTNVCENLTTDDGGGFIRLFLVMEYAPLPPVDFDNTPMYSNTEDVAGVSTVFIHGGENLRLVDKHAPSPYCVIYADRHKVCTSAQVNRTRNADWNCQTEFLVSDYTKCPITVMVHHNDGMAASERNLLGVAHIKLTRNEYKLVEQTISLQPSMFGVANSDACGTLVVSAIFRPVLTLSKPEKHQQLMQEFVHKNLPKSRRNSESRGVQKSVTLSGQASTDSTGVDSGFKEAIFSPLLEFTILRAKDLISTKTNGSSDPYCEMKIGAEVKFRTTTKCKTVAPVWEESVTITLPNDDEFLELIIWDRDRLFVKDFLGSVNLGIDELRTISSQGTPHWFQLQGVPTGHIQCFLKMSHDTKSVSGQATGNPLARRPSRLPESFDSVFDADSSSQGTAPGTPSRLFSSKTHKRKKSGEKEKMNNNNNNDVNKRSSSSGSNLSEPVKLPADHDSKAGYGAAVSPQGPNMVLLSNTEFAAPPTETRVSKQRQMFMNSRSVSFDDSRGRHQVALSMVVPTMEPMTEANSPPRSRKEKMAENPPVLRRIKTSPSFFRRTPERVSNRVNEYTAAVPPGGYRKSYADDDPTQDANKIVENYMSRAAPNGRRNSRDSAREHITRSTTPGPVLSNRNSWHDNVMETNIDDDVQVDDPVARRINIEYERALKPKKRSIGSRLRRAGSEPNVTKSSQRRSRHISDADFHRASRQDWAMKKSDSVSSLGSNHSITANASLKGSDLDLNFTDEKYYYVVGKLIKARGIHNLKGDLYCKIRVDSRPTEQRMQKLSQGKVLAKSARMKPESTCDFNKNFVVDTGSGVTADSLLIFDIKNTYKEYIASKGLTLKYLIQDQFELTKWVNLENNVDILLQISHGDPSKVKMVQQSKGPVAKLKRTFSASNIVKDTEL